MTGRSNHDEPLVLGIDTSAYTTSVAVLTLDGRRVSDRRIVLDVPPGRRGLRQSAAVFQHVNNLPLVLEAAAREAGGRLVAVGASVAPRSHPDSYMPVFRAGESVARSLAAWHDVPFVPVSHQDGHIWAGLWSAQPAADAAAASSEEAPAAGPSRTIPWAEVDDVIVMHASGGTTELFRAARRRGPEGEADRGKEDGTGEDAATRAGWHVELLSASEDLYAGQFVDRSGVRLGLPFPAGPHLERLAVDGDPAVAPLPVAVKGERLSFSGPDTAAQRLVEQGIPPVHVAASVQQCLAESLARWAKNVLSAQPELGTRRGGSGATGLTRPPFLGVGGVMANRQLRDTMADTLAEIGIDCLFAAPRYSVDNALGVALAAAMHYRSTS